MAKKKAVKVVAKPKVEKPPKAQSPDKHTLDVKVVAAPKAVKPEVKAKKK